MLIDQLTQINPQYNIPLVSIVMATHNGLKYIRPQLDSILAQTYPNIEIIITDDASTDGTPDVLQSYADIHKNIHLILSKENIGYVKNFERGMLMSKGDLIAPSDQDDIWKAEKIEKLVNAIGDSGIVYCDSELIDSDGNSLGIRLSQIRRFVCFRDVLNYTVSNSAPGHAMLIKRKIIYDAIPFPAVTSHDFWLGFVATFSNGLLYFNEVLVQYRQHSNNVFGSFKAKDSNGKKFKRKKDSKFIQTARARARMKIMYEKCPNELTENKEILKTLHDSYQNFSFVSNWRRMIMFFRYRDQILAYKRRNKLRKFLYCFKLFVTVQ